MTDRRLLRELGLVLVIKLLLLAALWMLFIRDERLAVDTEHAAAAIVGTRLETAPGPEPQGEHHGH
ncbi:MAG TPA: hypothetical protein VGE12_17690 [Noviherbaspirillum sp.]